MGVVWLCVRASPSPKDHSEAKSWRARPRPRDLDANLASRSLGLWAHPKLKTLYRFRGINRTIEGVYSMESGLGQFVRL